MLQCLMSLFYSGKLKMLGRKILLASLRSNGVVPRCRNFSNAARQSCLLKTKSIAKHCKRSGSYRCGYRTDPPEDPLTSIIADGALVFFWTFQFYMAYHHIPGMINYGVEYLDTSKLTDAQLGIEE